MPGSRPARLSSARNRMWLAMACGWMAAACAVALGVGGGVGRGGELAQARVTPRTRVGTRRMKGGTQARFGPARRPVPSAAGLLLEEAPWKEARPVRPLGHRQPEQELEPGQ